MSTTWCRRSTRRCTIQSPGSGNGLPSRFSSVASTSSSPAQGSRSGSRTVWRGRLERTDEPGGALAARRAPPGVLGVVAQAGVGDAAVAAREVDGDRPAVEVLRSDAVARRRAPPAARRRPAAPGAQEGRPRTSTRPLVPERAPPGALRLLGRPRRRQSDVRVLAALDDELEELVERGGEVGVDVVAQVDAGRQRGLGGAAQHLAAHRPAGVAVVGPQALGDRHRGDRAAHRGALAKARVQARRPRQAHGRLHERRVVASRSRRPRSPLSSPAPW